MFIQPMLAKSLSSTVIRPGEWSVEVKFDGHRIIVEVENGKVQAWSRNALPRELPPHVIERLKKFPNGIYDGELIEPNGGYRHPMFDHWEGE